MDRINRLVNLLALVILSLSLAACGYKGDGEFQTHDIWPLERFELTLPSFPLQEGYSGQFNIDGYRSHGTSHLTLIITAPEAIDFSKSDVEIDVRISDALGTDFFHHAGAINSYFSRSDALGKRAVARPGEWRCRYLYQDPLLNKPLFPFQAGAPLRKTKELKCLHSMPSGKSQYDVLVNVGNVPPELAGATARIELSSSWK